MNYSKISLKNDCQIQLCVLGCMSRSGMHVVEWKSIGSVGLIFNYLLSPTSVFHIVFCILNKSNKIMYFFIYFYISHSLWNFKTVRVFSRSDMITKKWRWLSFGTPLYALYMQQHIIEICLSLLISILSI